MAIKCTPNLKFNNFIIFTVAIVLNSYTPVYALQESSFEITGAEFQLIAIPPGSFIMGSNSHDGDERPAHKVTIDYSFEIGKTEVTVAQFRAFVKASGYTRGYLLS